MLRRAIFFALLIFSCLCCRSWAEDCGLRGYDGTEIVKFNCEPAAATTSPLQVRTPSGIRGIVLVDESAAVKSKFRARLPDGTIKALDIVGITTCEELQMIGFHPKYPSSKNYKLGQDIDCAATNPANWTNPAYANQLWQLGYAARFPKGFDGASGSGDENLTALNLSALGANGFKPIGDATAPFSGTLDGAWHVISNLTINRSGGNYLGLFGATKGSNIKNIGLVNVRVDGGSYLGGLVGYQNAGSIANSYASGNGVVASYSSAGGVCFVGGLVGYNYSSYITAVPLFR